MKVARLFVQLKRFLAASLIAILLMMNLNPAAVGEGISLQIQSVEITPTQVEGSRGAALAVLQDGSLLLGGGQRGDTLFLYSQGKIGRASCRERV